MLVLRGRLLPSLNAIRRFEAVARFNSFTRAAEDLNLTQSAANRLVRSFEVYLQVQLFVREGRRIELTYKGKVVQCAGALVARTSRSRHS